METKLNVTKGVASLEVRKAHILLHVGENNKTKNVADIWFTDETRNNGIADAKLIRDAFNTHNTTGKTPSELMQERDELLEALTKGRDMCDMLRFPTEEELKSFSKMATELIQKHSTNV